MLASALSQRHTRVFSPVRGLRYLLAVQRSRRALAGLSPTQLADVGLSPQDAQKEAQRRIWDAPETAWDVPRQWRG